ncbi:KpsF/GutQ family sugar-phosphate isomerase [Oceanibium sediminis]|uniref:KpsF/GutQ family sugar-phosphate isomerase n=1 Tax=Oceanibium sediminis TaxID=2026339 RepID=UPI001E55179C|nr:KpsF/GutQ family sugar-phosphate isomerase [Oceanibium sediminis]
MAPDDPTDRAMIARGQLVLRTEAEAITALADGLGPSFAAAVRTMLGATGRIIVSGMGKSGHIARKIAATMASTGTPAMFVHPGEASHGDLGMITRHDVALLLSNSGETPELADIIAYTLARGIPLIGITSAPNSTLVAKADHAIVLPPAAEACPNGLAPTTSTTVTLALGDALAVAMMEQRAFTPENFRDFHPGGKLGAILSTVGDLMHGREELPLVTPQDPMSRALLEISSRGFGVAGVVDGEGALLGVITDGDLRRNMADLMSRTAEQVMTPSPKTISPDVLATEALARMNREKITTLFVMPAGAVAPVGILHIHDCLRAGLG